MRSRHESRTGTMGPVDINGSKDLPIKIGSSSVYIYHKVKIHFKKLFKTNSELQRQANLTPIFFDDLFLFRYIYSFYSWMFLNVI